MGDTYSHKHACSMRDTQYVLLFKTPILAILETSIDCGVSGPHLANGNLHWQSKMLSTISNIDNVQTTHAKCPCIMAQSTKPYAFDLIILLYGTCMVHGTCASLGPGSGPSWTKMGPGHGPKGL